MRFVECGILEWDGKVYFFMPEVLGKVEGLFFSMRI